MRPKSTSFVALLVLGSLVFAASASAADPIRTDTLTGKRIGGVGYKRLSGKVSYPWPTEWLSVTDTMDWGPIHTVDLANDCSADIGGDNLAIAVKEEPWTKTIKSKGSLASVFPLQGVAGRTFHIASGKRADGVWWLYAHQAYVAYEPAPDNFIVEGRTVVKIATNRYLRHRVWADFTGPCTDAQLTSSEVTNAIKASVRDAVASVKIVASGALVM